MYYDDNFGEWEGMDPSHPDFEDNLQFYRQVARESVWKKCSRCGRRVKLRPSYGICNRCADMLERGFDC